ncbi:MAG: DoxX family protein [Pseudomonadota bacterium]
MTLQNSAYVAGRAGLASLFLLGGLNKLFSGDATSSRLQEIGLEPIGVFLSLTIGFELIAGLTLAVGIRFAWIAAMGLAAFTLTTNALFHRFWELDGELAALELSLFFKNIAIAGALLALASVEYASLKQRAVLTVK